MALTFDDGPDPRVTPQLLDLLASARARVTFFPIAPRAEAHPQLIVRMLEDGHSVGLHCDQHERHSSRDIAWGRADADRALARLRALGARPGLWRTPWGDLASWSEQVAAERTLRLVHWDLDTHDWRGDSAAEMFSATRDELAPGTVVLAHDGIGPGARRCDAAATLAYVELVLAHAAQRGLGLGALS